MSVSSGDCPLTEEIRVQIFGSLDYPVFLDSLLSDRDSVYSRENLFENVFDMYGDSYENSLEILAIVILVSPISSVRGIVLSRSTVVVLSRSWVVQDMSLWPTRTTLLCGMYYKSMSCIYACMHLYININMYVYYACVCTTRMCVYKKHVSRI